jgi:hypothetical protein
LIAASSFSTVWSLSRWEVIWGVSGTGTCVRDPGGLGEESERDRRGEGIGEESELKWDWIGSKDGGWSWVG